MALRNAFDGIATEGGLRKIASLLNFARDVNDRLRVVVDSGTINNAVVYNRGTSTWLANDVSASYQSGNSWNAIDAREPLKMSHTSRADFVKRNRWTY